MTYTISMLFIFFMTMMGYARQETASAAEKIILVIAITLDIILCLIHEKRLLDDLEEIKEKIKKNQEDEEKEE